jgi:hypothetical protein
MKIGRMLGVTLIACLAMAVFATSAMADTIYDTLDGTIDSTHELMNLTYPGAAGSTTIELQIDGRPDHPGCNIQGGAHWISLIASTSPAGIADISWANGDSTFDSCDEILTVIVTPLAVGSTTVTFAEDDSNTNGDPHITWSFAEATFDVNVTAGSGGNVCDADPAAPAWAAAILQKNGYKPKSSSFSNYVSQVAHHMGNGATFGGYAKNAHPDYENAVHDWMVSALGLSLPKTAAESARPGWVCTAIA